MVCFNFQKITLLSLACLTFSAAASATTITISGQNFNVDQGGGFSADLNGASGNIFEVFCADYRNTVDPPETYSVNIDTDSTGIADTRYGTTATAGFSFQDAPDGAAFGNAANRYLLAGWLTTQFDMSPGANTGNRDLGIQNAVWNILDTNAVNHTDGSVAAWENNAVVWEQTQTPAQLLAFAGDVRIYSSTDIGTNNNLTNSDNGRYSVGEQEMLSVTPEPGVMVLVGSGLMFLGLLRRRSAKK